jgi:two-component system phosphate regulon sensor histidine kinase PhoR
LPVSNRILRSLLGQLIISFTALSLLTAVVMAVPAVWLIRGQLERQAWQQVERGASTVQALYDAQASQLAGLAMLTAQRPTLQNLLSEDNLAELPDYLDDLRRAAGLDLALICGPSATAIAGAGLAATQALCATSPGERYAVIPLDGRPTAWMLAAEPVPGGATDGSRVIVGLALDTDFAERIRGQSGLEHTLVSDGQALATSFAAGYAPIEIRPGRSQPDFAFVTADQPYYATSILLTETSPPTLAAEVALSIRELASTSQRLSRLAIAAVLLATVLGAGAGALLARRIGQPLSDLATAATALSQGDLETPVHADPAVREVALVGYALEDARAALSHTLLQLRQEKAWIEHLLESIVEGIMTLDARGRVTFLSPAAERITGWTAEQAIGRPCDELFPLVDSAEPFTAVAPPPGGRRRITVRFRDGRQATLAFTGARLAPPDAGQASVALVMRDVTDEAAIHRLLGEFLANIAHEFRTPLSALAASIELLLDQLPDLNPAELQELLNSLHLGTLGLQTLVDNLLEAASIEAGRFRVYPRPADLGEIIRDAARLIEPLLAKRGQQIRLKVAPGALPVTADPRRTAQVIINLLSNASKYSPDDSEIALAAVAGDQWLRVTVADRGPGIPAEQRQELFRRFVRSNRAGEAAQYGVGLGLSVVKAIVEAQGGQVGVDERPGGGSLFWFNLPRNGDHESAGR